MHEVVEETSIGINPNGTAVKIRKEVEEDVLYLTQCHSSENKERPLKKDCTLVSIHKASSACTTLSLYHMHWYASISAERPTQGQDDTVSEVIVLSKNTQSWERRLRVRSEISTSPPLFKRSKQQQHTKKTALPQRKQKSLMKDVSKTSECPLSPIKPGRHGYTYVTLGTGDYISGLFLIKLKPSSSSPQWVKLMWRKSWVI